ncbi:MAG TPA: hypothetical protein VNH18_14095 [Bryobacteraceae bacterium]|nr:hypothetical protein [Bryobacteraceae bacterium]
MTETLFHNRRAVQLENDQVRVTVTTEGGHIAEILEKSTGVNPLWRPPWPSIECSAWSAGKYPEYGNDSESKLLAGLMGHNLCLDMFGAPSEAEAAAGMVAHAEAGVVPYAFESTGNGLTARCVLPASQLAFARTLRLDGRRVLISETVENLCALDRPIAWTQHVTLGPPFVENGKTQFRLPATKSRGIGETTDFDWPLYPQKDGSLRDLQVYTAARSSASFTSHLLDAAQPRSWFTAWSPASNVAIGYVWNRADFPWMGIWEQNRERLHPPWLGRTQTRGMEFGVSPFPESRRQMIERGSLFGEPGYRWIPARGKLSAEYYAAITPATSVPATLTAFEDLL